jgi:hypothetical protein
MEQALPKKIQSVLERYPFSMRPVQCRRREKPAHREIILTKLRCDMTIIDDDVQFLEAHPEAARWLKHNAEPQLWMKIQSLLESSQDDSNICADRADALIS